MTARPFTLDKRSGKIMGVCAGAADYFEADVTLIRIATVLLTIFLLGAPMLLAYLAIGLVANDRTL